MKVTEAIAEMLIDINNCHWAHLSCKKPAGKLKEQGVIRSEDTVQR